MYVDSVERRNQMVVKCMEAKDNTWRKLQKRFVHVEESFSSDLMVDDVEKAWSLVMATLINTNVDYHTHQTIVQDLIRAASD